MAAGNIPAKYYIDPCQILSRLGEPHSTVDSILAYHPATPDSNPRGNFEIPEVYWQLCLEQWAEA